MAVLTPEQEASVRTQFAPGGQAADAKPKVAEGKVELPPTLSVKELAEYLDVKTVDIIKELMKNGVMANINQQIDFDTAAIVADSFGVQASPMAMDSAIAEEVVSEGDGTQVKLTTRSELFSVGLIGCLLPPSRSVLAGSDVNGRRRSRRSPRR